MRKSTFRKIVITGTPRTGSNLLMHSLASHPQAVCGGEWYNIEKHRSHPIWWENKTLNPSEVNLCKVFPPEDVPFPACVVYLYRNDLEAQIASWGKACRTGEWIAGHFSEPTEFPANAVEVIEQAEQQYKPIADIAISYEAMVRNWDATVSAVLSLAGWEQITLTQQTAVASAV